MERIRIHVHVLICFTYLILPAVRSVPCQWADSILSEGACFLYNSTQLSYLDAKSACQSKGGVLAKVTSQTQVYDTTKQLESEDYAWIGANDIDIEGTWVWADNSTVATDFWVNYTLTNYSDEADCALIFASSSTERILTDQPCYLLCNFLCMENDVITTPDPDATTSTTNDPATTNPGDNTKLTMKCGANFVHFNILFVSTLLVFIYLLI